MSQNILDAHGEDHQTSQAQEKKFYRAPLYKRKPKWAWHWYVVSYIIRHRKTLQAQVESRLVRAPDSQAVVRFAVKAFRDTKATNKWIPDEKSFVYVKVPKIRIFGMKKERV